MRVTMREIKFRGKRLDNGEWVYGDLLQPTRFCQDAVFISSDTTYGNAEDDPFWIFGRFIKVDPKTVGQDTGLRESDQREIYEGDVLKYRTRTALERDFWYTEVVKWDDELGGFAGSYYFGRSNDLEVLGNIYDNPELLNPNKN